MIDLKAYRSLHKDNQYDNAGYRTGLADELGPEALSREGPPDDKFELLLPPTIKGFNIRRKKWYDLIPERVRDVEWNTEAFQKVVMNRKAKDLIRALVSNQLAVEASTPGTDLIEGKGNGLILLLHGSPGTGKTLTAESVAEIAKKPLYRVTCADIGTKAEAAEKYLESILHLGKLWQCVVLLDEADVFLEQRSLEDLERNALVSVFLRILEYYEGILILTSNRVGTFDEAFKSRIQLALHYPALGPYERLRIWENFLERLEKLKDDAIDTGDLRDHLADLQEEEMNGRQIRNAITTARQYAKWKGETLTYAQLKDVIEVAGRFDKYLVKLHKGLTHDQLAEDEGLRLG
jgi:SpoVK/Ycf46/Vps4 family AAA+-type ATPase